MQGSLRRFLVDDVANLYKQVLDYQDALYGCVLRHDGYLGEDFVAYRLGDGKVWFKISAPKAGELLRWLRKHADLSVLEIDDRATREARPYERDSERPEIH